MPHAHQSMLDVVQVSAECLLDNDLQTGTGGCGLYVTYECGKQRQASHADGPMPNTNSNRTSPDTCVSKATYSAKTARPPYSSACDCECKSLAGQHALNVSPC